MRVLFVGDEPSARNNDPKVAFVGTKSGDRLKRWADYLGVTYHAVNSDDKELLTATIRMSERFCQPIITLGNKARLRVKRIADENGYALYCYHLPHPSFRNRLFNDKRYEQICLDKVKKLLYPESYE